jgi:YidC/Oxa1 family membrane protein insertase
MLHLLGLLYTDVIYRPILNLLVFLYNIMPGHDVGIVIILVTIIIRLILAPLFHKSLKGQKAMNALQPKLTEMREKHKDDKAAQSKAMMELYKEHKINPLSSCLPVLVQLPILIALYQVFIKALHGNLNGLYHFVTNPGVLNPKLLNLLDLSKPNIVLAVLAGAAQFWQSKMMMPPKGSGDATMKAMSVQTTYILPIISVIIALKLPAGLPLYWIVTTLFAIGQQYYINRKHPTVEVVS